MNELSPLTLAAEFEKSNAEQRQLLKSRAAIEAHEARKVPVGWRELMSEALDNALASTVEEGISHDRRAYRRELAQRIKQALDASAPPAPQASVVQEPVAVIGPSFQVLWTRQIPLEGLRVGDALYTHPQPAKQEPLDCLHINKGSADAAATQYEVDYWADRFQDKADHDKLRGALHPVSYYVRSAIQTMLAHGITKEQP